MLVSSEAAINSAVWHYIVCTAKLLCFICYNFSGMLFRFALSAMLYPQCFICYALSAMLYPLCFIHNALSAMLYPLCLGKVLSAKIEKQSTKSNSTPSPSYSSSFSSPQDKDYQSFCPQTQYARGFSANNQNQKYHHSVKDTNRFKVSNTNQKNW